MILLVKSIGVDYIMYKTPSELMERFKKENPKLIGCSDVLWQIYETIKTSFESGGKLLLCGNGGSAADCDHITGELMKGFLLKRPVPDEFKSHPALDGEGEKLQGALPAISLVGQTALTTAYANDVDAEFIYAQQVYGLGRTGDTLLGISTSGNARNICRALRVARALDIKTIGLTGESGGNMRELCDICLCVPANETYRIQELHLPTYHTLCAMLEATFFTT
jgi:D-sedoheptulose 7-phosphate isomerase